jgi:hypothetical protein
MVVSHYDGAADQFPGRNLMWRPFNPTSAYCANLIR